jgi:hypothetical protein
MYLGWAYLGIKDILSGGGVARRMCHIVPPARLGEFAVTMGREP